MKLSMAPSPLCRFSCFGFICRGLLCYWVLKSVMPTASVQSGQDNKRHHIVMLLDLLELFYKKQKTGESISEAQALEVLGQDRVAAGRAMSPCLKSRI